MKNRSYLTLINAMFWIFILGFLIHLLAFSFHIFPRNLKYGWGGWINHKDSVWEITTHGKITIAEPLGKTPVININDSIGKRTNIKFYNSAFAAFFYSDLKKAINDKAILVILLDILNNLCWLIITFQLMRIFTNLKRNKVFELSIIRRLRIIAIVIALAPALQKLRHYWFNRVIELNIDLSIQYQATFRMISESFYGIIPAVLIIILAEIFKHGLLLKQENDLTI